MRGVDWHVPLTLLQQVTKYLPFFEVVVDSLSFNLYDRPDLEQDHCWLCFQPQTVM